MNIGSLNMVLNEVSAKELDSAFGTNKFTKYTSGTLGQNAYNLAGDASEWTGEMIGNIFNLPHIALGAASNIPVLGRAFTGFKNSVDQNYQTGRAPFEHLTGKSLRQHVDSLRKRYKR